MRSDPESAPIRNGGRMTNRDRAFWEADLEIQRRIYARIKSMTNEERSAKALEMNHAHREGHFDWVHKHYPGLSKEEFLKQCMRSLLTEQEFYGHFPNDKYDPEGNKPYVPQGPAYHGTILYEEELANAPHAHC